MGLRKILVADLLCGAGGSSTGCARALAELGLQMELVCVNHWGVAIETHKKNHPEARHYCQDIASVRPHIIVPEGYLDLLMASPTSDQQRSDPWHIVTWLTELRVKRLIIENVWEFIGWGPVDPRTGKPAASAVATKLALRKHGLENVVIAYCETHAEDPDNERFLKDCERWFNAPITRLASTEYADTWDVWERRRYLAGVNGATCTVELKVAPRLEFQRPHDIHVFGYTLEEAKRAERFRANYPELKVEAPLIEAGLRKRDCLAMVKNAGIELPALYALGFQNNNCMPCVKATSPDYWALVRKVRPEHFARMAKLSRELDVRLARLKGERIFIDEIPADHPTTNPIVPSCDFLCAIAEQEIAA